MASQSFTETKMAVLYLLSQAAFEVPVDLIETFILDHEYTNYFFLKQSEAELLEDEMIGKKDGEDEAYFLTEEGNKTLELLKDEYITEVMQTQVDRFLESKHLKKGDRYQTRAVCYVSEEGKAMARCQLYEKGVLLVDMNLAVPSMEAAREVCANWPVRCKEMYSVILGELI